MKIALESNFGSYSSSCTRKYEMKGKNYGMSGDKLEARTRIGGKIIVMPRPPPQCRDAREGLGLDDHILVQYSFHTSLGVWRGSMEILDRFFLEISNLQI